nr:hypothetical protein [Micromonospora sp. DSM 115978]
MVVRILRAREISALAAQGILIRDQFRPKHCEGVTYSLTLGSRVQSITRTERSYRKIDGALVLEPRESVNVEINEKFNFLDGKGRPAYCGLVIAGAKLLAGGVSHPATFIDPGFQHTTTLTLVNLRNHPSRSFRPGSDYIAKLIVFSLTTAEIPEGWEATSAYRQSGPDDLPVLWSDSHLLASWTPRGADPAALSAVPQLGPPYDLLASHLLEQRDLLVDDTGQQRSVRDVNREIITLNRELTHVTDTTSRQLALLDRAQKDLAARVAGQDSELANMRRASQEESLRRQRERTDASRYRGNLIIAVVSAIVGALVSAWLTVTIAGNGSPDPAPAVTPTVQGPTPSGPTPDR